MKARYIIRFEDRYEPQEILYFVGKLTSDLLNQSTDDPSCARRFTTYEAAVRTALALANIWGEDYRFYVRASSGDAACLSCKAKGGEP